MYKRILEEPDILVDYYNDGKAVIRISLFKDGHYSDQYFYDALKTPPFMRER